MSIPSIAPYLLPEMKDVKANKVNWQLAPNRAALLIHDVQHYFVGFYGADNPLINAVIENIRRLKHFCQQQGIPVFYTAQPIKQQPALRGLLTDMWGQGLQDPAQQPIVAQLTPGANDIVLTKWRYSAFQKSDFAQQLAERGRDQLIICGIYAHIGVLATALEAFMQDIQPFVVADAIADFSRDEHIMALNYVATRCGAVCRTLALTESADSTEDLCSRAGLTSWVLARIDCSASEFDADESLLDYGLNSVEVMRLLGLWQQAGITVNFIELAQVPTLNGWLSLLAEHRTRT